MGGKRNVLGVFVFRLDCTMCVCWGGGLGGGGGGGVGGGGSRRGGLIRSMV